MPDPAAPPELPAIATDTGADEARAALEAAGWRLVGAGDWSWALADPTGAWAARITPFDPAYGLFARDCLAGPTNPWLPRMAALIPLRREGHVVVMERLWPAPAAAASAFCAALGIANDTGYEPPDPGPEVAPGAPGLADLRARLQALIARGAARHRLWAGSDIRAGNVMADARGDLKLIDPVGLAGWKIAQALREGNAEPLAGLTRDLLADFLTIPYFGPGREGHVEHPALAANLASLFG